MVNERFTSDNTHIALATGDDAGGGSGLTAWRNADAAFISGELQPTDQFIGGDNIKFPKPKTEEIGALHSVAIAHTDNGRLVVAFTEDFKDMGKAFRQTYIIGADGDGASPSWSNETMIDDPSGNSLILPADESKLKIILKD